MGRQPESISKPPDVGTFLRLSGALHCCSVCVSVRYVPCATCMSVCGVYVHLSQP